VELKYRRTKGLTAKYELGTVKTGTDNKRLGELGCEHAQLQYPWSQTFRTIQITTLWINNVFF